MANLTRIADVLQEHLRARRSLAITKADLLRIAVEDLSIPQDVVCRGDVVTLLDGYLRGAGMAPKSEASV
jgi:hypothetical protein